MCFLEIKPLPPTLPPIQGRLRIIIRPAPLPALRVLNPTQKDLVYSKTGPDTCLLVPRRWWLWFSKDNSSPAGPCQAPQPERRGPHTFVPLQDILVGLEVLLLLHVQVSGWGEVPRHAEVYLSDDWPIPLSPSEPWTVSSQQDAALITGKAEGAAAWGRAQKPETQSRGARGRRAPEPAEETPRPPVWPRVQGRQAPGEPESLSGFSSSKSRRARGRRPAAPRRAEEPGARRGQAGGSRRRDPRRPMRPPPWPFTKRLLPARPRPRRPCGRTRALPPPGMLRGASAAFPGRRAADTRPRPRREGGGRRAEGRGARAAVSTPAGSAPTPAPLGPSLLSRATAAQVPSPARPPQLTAPPSTPTPGHWPAGPGSPRTRFLFGTHNRCLGNKAADRGRRRAQPPAEGPAALPREGVAGRRVGNTFFNPAYGTRLWSPCGSAERKGHGGPRPGHISRAGRAASAGGPAHQGLTARARVRLRGPPPGGGQRTCPRSLPFAPQSRPANLPLSFTMATGPVPSQLPQLTMSPPSSRPLFIPRRTGIQCT